MSLKAGLQYDAVACTTLHQCNADIDLEMCSISVSRCNTI